MTNIFSLSMDRKIIVAGQNIFQKPIKHPSGTLNEHIISYVVKGGWRINVGGEVILAKADSVFVQPANIPHVGIENCPPDTHTLFLHFSAHEGDRSGKNAEAITEGEVAISTLTDAESNPEIKRIIIKIIEEEKKGNSEKALSYLNVLFCEMSEASVRDKSKYALAEKIKKLLIDPTKSLRNDEIAQKLGVGIRSAETAFKECFGISIHKYQLTQKIEQAKFCLEYYPDMKIIDLALSLGFYDEFHFSRQFKRATGHSPTDYKRLSFKEKHFPPTHAEPEQKE